MAAQQDDIWPSEQLVPEGDMDWTINPAWLNNFGLDPEADLTPLPFQNGLQDFDWPAWTGLSSEEEISPFRPGHGREDLALPVMQDHDETMGQWQTEVTAMPADNSEADLLARIRDGPGVLPVGDLEALLIPLGFPESTTVPVEDTLPQLPPPAAPKPQQAGYRPALAPMAGASQQEPASFPMVPARQIGPSRARDSRARRRTPPALAGPSGTRRGPGRPRLADEDKAQPYLLWCRYCIKHGHPDETKQHRSGEGLRAHMGIVHNIVHPEQKAHKCDKCKHKYCRASDLSRHNRSSPNFEHKEEDFYWVEGSELPQTQEERADTWALDKDGPMNNALIVGREKYPGRSKPSDRKWKPPGQ